MILFYGNCQAQSFMQRFQILDEDCAWLRVPATDAIVHSTGSDMLKARKIIAELGLQNFTHQGSIINHFDLGSIFPQVPDVFVLSTHHELSPLFECADGSVFYIDEQAFEGPGAALGAWVRGHCARREVTPQGYVQRYFAMVHALLQAYPKAQFVLFKRLGDHPFFQGAYAALDGWAAMEADFIKAAYSLARQRSNVHVLSMETILWECMEEKRIPYDHLAPLARFKTQGDVMTVINDCEHLSGVFYDHAARKLLTFLETGDIGDSYPKTIDFFRSKRARRSRHTPAELDRFLASADVDLCRIALMDLFLRLPEDNTHLILAHRHTLPAESYVLMILRYYKKATGNPALKKLIGPITERIAHDMADLTPLWRDKFRTMLQQLAL